MSRIEGYAMNALKTDLYELTMAAGYFQNNVNVRATFEMFCHQMPANRSYLVVCGLEQAMRYIQNLRFSKDDVDYLRQLPVFSGVKRGFFDYLKDFKFSGDVWAMREGEVAFANEPIFQVTAPIIEAQILETYLLSVFNIQSMVASKAARIVREASADGTERAVVDFGSRRAHGPAAGIHAADAAYMAGCQGTSNVFAAKLFDIPVYGTMAHSWVEAFDREEDAFLSYYKVFPENNIILVDTFDTIKAVKKICRMKDNLRFKAVRLDSGDLNALSKKVRKILDEAGLQNVKIIASGNLNEFKIKKLIDAKAPIDIFGVGTEMVTSRDEPSLDLTYKLVQIQEADKTVKYKYKRSKGKKTVPARKEVFRYFTKKGVMSHDQIGLFDETAPEHGERLLHPVMEKGALTGLLPTKEKIRRFTRQRLSQLPKRCLDIGRNVRLKVGYSERLDKLRKGV